MKKKANKKELKALVEETNYVEQCCEPTAECPNPTPGCCSECECPPKTCDKARELQAKYRELDDEDYAIEEKKCCTIAGCPMCWKTIVFIAIVLLLIFVSTK